MSSNRRLLFVDDETAVQRAFVRSMHGLDIAIQCVSGVNEAIAALKVGEYAVVVTDMTMTDGTGLDVLRAMSTHAPRSGRIVLSGDQDVAAVVVGTPVDVVLTKPWDVTRLRRVVSDAMALAATRAKST
ncbi:MAG TPA: response regulator [Myxococcota bacterium]|nr:response regulator [Myxococcota bacterium]